VTFLGEAAFVRAAARAGGAARLRAHERCTYEVGEAGAGAFEDLGLGTGFVADDEDATVGVEAATGEGREPGADGHGQDDGVTEVEAKLDFGRDFVDVLTAGAAGAHGRPFELGAREGEGVGREGRS